MSVLSRSARSSHQSDTAPTGTAPAAGIPAPRPAQHDQGVSVRDRLRRQAQDQPEGSRRRVALVLAALLLACAAIGTGVVVATDGDEPTVMAPGVLNGIANTEAQRDAAAARRNTSSDGSRASEAQRDAAHAARNAAG